MKSFGIVLEESKGLGRGFDFMRIALSLAVVTRHVISLAGPASAGANPGAETSFGSGLDWIISYSILIMFFGLSGFLISGSAMRLTLKNFLIVSAHPPARFPNRVDAKRVAFCRFSLQDFACAWTRSLIQNLHGPCNPSRAFACWSHVDIDAFEAVADETTPTLSWYPPEAI